MSPDWGADWTTGHLGAAAGVASELDPVVVLLLVLLQGRKSDDKATLQQD